MLEIAPKTAVKPHILVVEDDAFVRDLLDIYLTNEGYRVTTAGNGAEMRACLASTPAQLVLMDVRLPGEDGFTLTRYLREQHNVAVIIITTRHETVDRVVGLECGADDYIIKPFEEREVLARIRSVLRRTLAAEKAQARIDQGGTLTFHGCVLDPETCTFRGSDNREQVLTGNEARLLAHLVRNAGHIQERDALMIAVLQRPWSPLDRSIDVLVTRVRQKIEADPKRPAIIKTVRGLGYIVPEPRPEARVSETAA